MQSRDIHNRHTPTLPAPFRLRRYIAAMALCLVAGVASAGNPPELAAEQLAIDRTSGTGVGDAMNQELAQTFVVLVPRQRHPRDAAAELPEHSDADGSGHHPVGPLWLAEWTRAGHAGRARLCDGYLSHVYQ